MAGFFYLCYTGSVHKIGEEVKLLKDYDWWVKAWNAYNNPPTKTIPLDASDALQGKITSVVVLDNYYEQRSTAPPTVREQISKVWNLDGIDCDFSSKDKLPTEDLKCVVYRGGKKTKVTLHASENKLGLYTQDGKRFPNQIGRI